VPATKVSAPCWAEIAASGIDAAIHLDPVTELALRAYLRRGLHLGIISIMKGGRRNPARPS